MQLAIDTSSDTAALALVREGHLLAELSWRCGQNHTVTLLPYLSQLLKQTGRDIKEIRSITVARGPGSYNGLRVGISAAKGLAYSLRVPLTGISTLEAIAYQQAAGGLPVCPVMGAGRGEIAAARYQMCGGEWRQLAAEHLTTPEALASEITSPTIICGESSSELHDQLQKSLGVNAVFTSAAAGMRRAGYLAELGQRRLAAGRADDPASLSPIYLRRPHITKPRADKNIVWRKP